MTPIQRFWNLLSPFKKEVYQIYLYAILNGLVNLSLPLGIQAIVNIIQMGALTTSWAVLVLFVLIGIIFSGVFQLTQLRIVENIQQEIFAKSSFEFAFRFPKIKLSHLQNLHTPELANRFFDTLTIQKNLPKILVDFSLAVFQAFFGLVLLSVYSPYFLILGVFLVTSIWVLFKTTSPKGMSTSILESKFKYIVAHWLEEVARTHKSFKKFSSFALHLKKTDKKTIDYLEAREKHFGVLVTQFKFFILFKVLLAAGLLILGGLLVYNEQMNIGQFVAAEIIILLILTSTEKLINSIDSIYDLLTALDKIGYITDIELDEKRKVDLKDNTNGISIDVSNLTYGSNDNSDNYFNNFNTNISSGAKSTIIGDNRISKSMFINIVSGFLEINSGAVKLDGIPIENINKSNLNKQLSIHFSTNELFEASLIDNITVGREISEDRLRKIISLMGLDLFVSNLPNGMDSIINPSNYFLSKDITQKVLLARALASRSRLYLFENPFLYLKQIDKERIIDFIIEDAQGSTFIVITDDEYWISKSDQQVIITKGGGNA
jgi:ABC-type bacteriocin/lantibiotic exporter with double-glycine peptidase domain